MLESLNYSFRKPKNIIWVIYRIKQLRNYKKTMGSSENPSLVNNVDELGLVYQGLMDNTIFNTQAEEWISLRTIICIILIMYFLNRVPGVA